jgi:hypothetical protein
MNSMYLLSLLLTADLGKAEEGFVSGFEDCVETPCVFREWGTISGSAFDYSECKSHLAPSQERGRRLFSEEDSKKQFQPSLFRDRHSVATRIDFR